MSVIDLSISRRKMPRLSRLLSNKSDAGLKLTSLALAGASLAFAISMTVSPPSRPQIHGMEHLSIYARPTRRSWETKTAGAPSIDYRPVGSLRKSAAPPLTGYEILRAAPEGATLRTPEGRVARVSRGSRIAGLGLVLTIERQGTDWMIRTEAGVIR